MSDHAGQTPARDTTPNLTRPMEFPQSPQLPQSDSTTHRGGIVPVDWFRRMPNGGTVNRPSSTGGSPLSSSDPDPFAQNLRVVRRDPPTDTNDTGETR